MPNQVATIQMKHREVEAIGNAVYSCILSTGRIPPQLLYAYRSILVELTNAIEEHIQYLETIGETGQGPEKGR